MIHLFRTPVLLLVCLIFMAGWSCRPASSDNAQSDLPSVFDRLSEQEIVRFQIRTDLTRLLAETDTSVYQPALLNWSDTQGKEYQYQIRIKIRGKSRKNFCDFPPLKLKFSKDELRAENLAPFNDIKLVTHCIENDTFVLKEYLAYQLYSALTDKSFRTQLARIEYTDTGGSLPTLEKYGFLIEDEQELARRFRGSIITLNGPIKSIDAEQYRMLTVFQYMIGNTDWNLSLSHNIKLLTMDKEAPPIPVPYDFDLSGLVDAPYALPHPMLPISDVKERFFQWRSKNTAGLDETLAYFNDQRDTLLQTCREFPILDDHCHDLIAGYLGSFFEIIVDPEQAKEKLLPQSAFQ